MLNQNQLRAKLGPPDPKPLTNRNACLQQKAAAKEAAELMQATALSEKRDFTAAEVTEFDKHIATIKECNAMLARHEKYATFSGQPQPYGNESQRPHLVSVRGHDLPGYEDAAKVTEGAFSDVASFINDGTGGIKAALSEGGQLQFVVPGYSVEGFVHAYPAVDPFGAAGATVFETDDGRTLKVPIIAAGSTVGTVAEEAGPSSVQDANVYIASLEANKYSFLTKITEEAAQDISTLENTLVTEGIRRVFNSVSNAVTDALVSSLSMAGALVSAGSDHLQSLLNLEAAIDPTWASPGNVFMMDRSSLSQLRNTRDLQDRPIFDPTAKTMLGYSVILNDRLRGKIIFGAFRPGVYIRRTPLVVQRLIELYTEQGKIGVRFQRRADQAFFADAATASQAPQPLFMLNADVGS